MHAHVILVNGDAEFLERLLSLPLDFLRALHLLFPGLVQTLHQLLARLQLLLKLCLGDGLDCTILGLVRDLLLRRGDLGIEDGLVTGSRNTR